MTRCRYNADPPPGSRAAPLPGASWDGTRRGSPYGWRHTIPDRLYYVVPCPPDCADPDCGRGTVRISPHPSGVGRPTHRAVLRIHTNPEDTP